MKRAHCQGWVGFDNSFTSLGCDRGIHGHTNDLQIRLPEEREGTVDAGSCRGDPACVPRRVPGQRHARSEGRQAIINLRRRHAHSRIVRVFSASGLSWLFRFAKVRISSSRKKTSGPRPLPEARNNTIYGDWHHYEPIKYSALAKESRPALAVSMRSLERVGVEGDGNKEHTMPNVDPTLV